MCGKASQTFFIDTGQAIDGQVLLTGPGVLTDVLQTIPTPSANTELRLKDGASKSGRLIMRFRPTAQHYFGGLNLEFDQGLWVECDQPGPNFAAFTIGAYIQDDSPDPMTVQLIKLREELTKQYAKLYDFLEKMFKGDPAV